MNIALLGNPNTGKTSLFNNLTGSYEYVGNWSGVTVEKKIGYFKNNPAVLVDLPGVYSLNPLSKDESVVTNFLLTEPFEKILNIVDASQLKRNLHLTLQLLEYGKPMTIGLNMLDVANHRGIFINQEKLTELLGIPVVSVIARSGEGCHELSEVVTSPQSNVGNESIVDYGEEVEATIKQLVNKLKEVTEISPRWLALQLLEGNEQAEAYIKKKIDSNTITKFVSQLEEKISKKYGKSLPQFIYQQRNAVIDQIIAETVTQSEDARPPLTDRIDRIVTNKYLGIPIFLLLMFFMFTVTFEWIGLPLSEGLEDFITGPLASGLEKGLVALGVSSFLQSLILEGIVVGVGGVLEFVPLIFILFFFISLLEDSGYMARVALVMDRIMESVGLNGKAFIPMLIGFGCNVPGIMAARTIETPKERLLTILISPLMSCSAKLPIYALFVGVFFVKYKAFVVLSLYVTGIVVALILAKIFSKTILKGETTLFVIELPPYRLPQIKGLTRSTWDKAKGFIKKAGTFILAGSVVIWLLSFFGPGGADVPLNDSYLAMIGGVVAPLLIPLGFGTWQAGAALITGFLAKEAVISTLSIIYFVPDENGLQGLLAQYFTPLAAYSFLIFILLYIPCLATTATIYKETGSKKWTVFTIGYALFIAYFLAMVIYQVGRLLGFS